MLSVFALISRWLPVSCLSKQGNPLDVPQLIREKRIAILIWRWTADELLVTPTICLLAEQCSFPRGKRKKETSQQSSFPSHQTGAHRCVNPNRRPRLVSERSFKVCYYYDSGTFLFPLAVLFFFHLSFFFLKGPYFCYLLAFPSPLPPDSSCLQGRNR